MSSMTMEFKLDQRAFAQAKKKLALMRERAQNAQPAWNSFLDWFTHGNRQQFGTQGKRWATPWRELKPATVRQKRSEGWTGDILVRSSTLLRSVADRPMSFERIGPHDMAAGTLVRYAAFQFYGAKRGRGHIPARPFWNVDQIQREGAMTSVMKTWIVSGRPTVNARQSR